MELHVPHAVSDPSDAGAIRRAAVALALRLDFSTSDAGRVALAATEAATNIVKHASRGTILLRAASELADRPGVELLALDHGPGMVDIPRAMADGFSTAGSPGTGLGALSRLASRFDIYSLPSRGTALLVQVLPQSAKPRADQAELAIGVVRVAKPGETVSGDAWGLALGADGPRLLVADGLGHGSMAAEAATTAVRQFAATVGRPLPQVLDAMHGALLPTRGAAVSIAEFALAASEVRFAGIGNVSGFLAWPGGSRRMVSQNGTVGVQIGRVLVAPYPWPPRAAVVMYSDGLNSRTTLDAYPGLLAHHPSLIAAVLYRDFARGTDDATVLVAARPGGTP